MPDWLLRLLLDFVVTATVKCVVFVPLLMRRMGAWRRPVKLCLALTAIDYPIQWLLLRARGSEMHAWTLLAVYGFETLLIYEYAKSDEPPKQRALTAFVVSFLAVDIAEMAVWALHALFGGAAPASGR